MTEEKKKKFNIWIVVIGVFFFFWILYAITELTAYKQPNQENKEVVSDDELNFVREYWLYKCFQACRIPSGLPPDFKNYDDDTKELCNEIYNNGQWNATRNFIANNC